MITVPPLWTWMTTHWCPLPSRLAWVLWHALSQAQWSTATQWRQTFLDFEAPDRALSRDLIEDFLEQIALPAQMMDLIEQLMKEKVLLRRDGHQMQAQLLAHVDREAQWKHQPRVKGGADDRGTTPAHSGSGGRTRSPGPGGVQ